MEGAELTRFKGPASDLVLELEEKGPGPDRDPPEVTTLPYAPEVPPVDPIEDL